MSPSHDDYRRHGIEHHDASMRETNEPHFSTQGTGAHVVLPTLGYLLTEPNTDGTRALPASRVRPLSSQLPLSTAQRSGTEVPKGFPTHFFQARTNVRRLPVHWVPSGLTSPFTRIGVISACLHLGC